MKTKIITTLKSGIKDNQGDAVLSALLSLGFITVTGVRIGKYFEITHDGRKVKAEKMAKVLTNEVMEDFTIED